MKALILNSGLGHRMGVLTSEHPKCMTEISNNDTILSHQLKQIVDYGIEEVVITTGYFDQILIDYCHFLHLPLRFTFVNNPVYDKTNYIYSIYCAKDHLNDDDIILMHGDLVFENQVFESVMESKTSCMTVSSTTELPEKDFKAVIEGDRITKVGVEFFDHAMAAQPLYKILKDDWKIWMERIIQFCESGNTNCYAEKAFNEVSDQCHLTPLDVRDLLCSEIDTPEDLEKVTASIMPSRKEPFTCVSLRNTSIRATSPSSNAPKGLAV